MDIGNRKMDAWKTEACVRDKQKFFNYIQENYRSSLNSIDYDILTDIAENYSSPEIIKAINYCKAKSSNSLMYLKDALNKKYYELDIKAIRPDWMDKEIKEKPLTEEDIIFAKEFYYQFCDAKEEAERRIKEVGLSI